MICSFSFRVFYFFYEDYFQKRFPATLFHIISTNNLAFLDLFKLIEGKKGKSKISLSSPRANTIFKSWSDFKCLADRFERQRRASDSGLAFTFTEGALVDAIRSGKW